MTLTIAALTVLMLRRDLLASMMVWRSAETIMPVLSRRIITWGGRYLDGNGEQGMLMFFMKAWTKWIVPYSR